MATREDWDRFQGTRRTEALRKREPGLQVIAREAPRMETLTGSPEWDLFVSHLEAMRVQMVGELESLREQSEHLLTIQDPGELLPLHLRKIVRTAEIRLIEQVIALPKSLIEDGKVALDQLRSLVESPESPPAA